MAVYKSCGVLGFFKPVATEQDFEESGYQPGKFVTSCGFLGFSPTPATLYSIPSSWRDDCTPLNGTKNGSYDVTAPGVCALKSCASGSFKTDDGRCVRPGTSCTPSDPQPHASYTYSAAGDCAFRSCSVGSVRRPSFGVSSIGSAACPTGYGAIADEATCKAAAEKYGIPFESGSVDEPGLLSGCVVHSLDSHPGKVSFNTAKNGVSAAGDQFVVCGRGKADPCVAVGEKCGATPNYTWNSKGYCQGSCKGANENCRAGEKCCSGVCTPQGDKCDFEKKLDDTAKTLGSQIHSLIGSFEQLKGSMQAFKKL